MTPHNSDRCTHTGDRERNASAYPVGSPAAARNDGDLVVQFKLGHLGRRRAG